MSSLTALLNEYEETWQEKGSDFSNLLRPGLPPEVIRAQLRSEGMGTPDEIIEWFAWHDGSLASGKAMSETRELPAMTIPEPLSLDDSLQYRRTMRQEAAYLAADESEPPLSEPSYYWQDGWLPIAIGGPPIFAVDTTSTTNQVPVLIVDWSDVGFEAPRTLSLAQPIRWAIDYLREHMEWSSSDPRWLYDGTPSPGEARASRLLSG